MRPKLDPQEPLDFSPSHLKVTREYHEKYRAVDEILTGTPEILNIFRVFRRICGFETGFLSPGTGF